MDAAEADLPADHDGSRSPGSAPPTIEPDTHVFIVKLWLDEREALGQTVWRGHITHVPSGARRYFDDLAEIELIVSPYLEALGVRRVRNDLRKSIRECLRRLWGGR